MQTQPDACTVDASRTGRKVAGRRSIYRLLIQMQGARFIKVAGVAYGEVGTLAETSRSLTMTQSVSHRFSKDMDEVSK